MSTTRAIGRVLALAAAMAALLTAAALDAPAAEESVRLVVDVRAGVSAPALSTLTLGDVAKLSGALAKPAREVAVGRAPRPQRRRALTRSALATALWRAGFERGEVRFEGAAQAIVRGEGRGLDVGRAEREIRAFIEERAGEELPASSTLRIVDVKLPAALQVAPGRTALTVGAHGPLHSGTNRFSLTVRSERDAPRRVPARAELEIEGPAVVIAREVPRGAVVSADDVRVGRARWPRTGALVTDAGRAVARVARVTLEVGEPLVESKLGPAVDVARGQTVRAVMRRGPIELALQTTALESGVAGSIVRVAGIGRSGRLDARVTGPGEVRLLGSDEPGVAAETTLADGAGAEGSVR